MNIYLNLLATLIGRPAEDLKVLLSSSMNELLEYLNIKTEEDINNFISFHENSSEEANNVSLDILQNVRLLDKIPKDNDIITTIKLFFSDREKMVAIYLISIIVTLVNEKNISGS